MRKEQNVFTGAAILAGAGMIVKVIGACFKIPLGALLRPEGIAIFSVAYNLYALLFSFATAGVPIAVSKQVAEALADGRRTDAIRIGKAALFCFSFVGLIGAAVLFLFAEPLAQSMGIAAASRAIRTVAPAVFFVSIVSVFRGYYQGHRDMIPTASSEVIEATTKLVLGLFCAWWLGQHGASVSVQAAGAIGGVTVGTVVSCLYFCLSRRVTVFRFLPVREHKTSYRVLMRDILLQTIPITLGTAVMGLTNVIDSALIIKLLQRTGYAVEQSMWLYGTYTYAANLFNLPSVLINTLAVSLIPTVAGAAANQQSESLKETTEQVLSVSALLALCAAFGLAALATPVMDLLYGNGVEPAAVGQAGDLLAVLCVGIPPLAITTITNALHQAQGRMKLPVISMLIGAMVKVIANACLIQNPKIHILGAAISTVMCYYVIAGINWMFLKRKNQHFISPMKLCVKPILVGLCTGLAAKLSYSWLVCFTPSELATMFSVFCGGAVSIGVSSCIGVSFLSVINAKISAKKVKR